ncbi:MAG: SIS domain-containing protein [bacterium]|nr:SIS domain-containing protein [bacterium]
MEEAIKKFNTQFEWKPVVENESALPRQKRVVLGGMGGSHLAGGLFQALRPEVPFFIHRDYGLPALLPSDLKESMYIADSFSGNTEEAVDFAEKALSKRLSVTVIAKGGKLLEFAQKHKLPHVVLPPTKIQPRSGLGFQILALAALLHDAPLLKELSKLTTILKPALLERQGKALVESLRGSIPVIYSSTRNQSLAYNWKIKMNETGKIPSFYNVFPELNHNEMTGFDTIETTEGLSRKLHFIFLTDSTDHPQIQKRMRVCKKLYEERGIAVSIVPLKGKSVLEKIFTSLLIADWTALHLSKLYKTEAEQVPMVEEFKRLIA